MPETPTPDEIARWAALHVIPLGDLVPHETDPSCACGPTVEIGDRGEMWSHHSLDGRDATNDRP